MPRSSPACVETKHSLVVPSARSCSNCRASCAAPALCGPRDRAFVPLVHYAYRGWTARFGLLNLAMVRSLGIEGKVYAGIFAILPDAFVFAGSLHT